MITLRQGDSLEVLKTLPDKSVQCVVTSPPYYGLRDYGTAQWVGGDENCDHRPATMREDRNEERRKLEGSDSTNSEQLILAANTECGKCGAFRRDKQIGLEKTPAEYLGKMLLVFREIWRVLKDDGTMWVNMGDTHTASGCGGDTGKSGLQGTTTSQDKSKRAGYGPRQGHRSSFRRDRMARQDEPHKGVWPLPAKSLIGMPWRLAFTLQDDGWILRQDIIWSKRQCMPESVRDRCTTSHEYIFMFAKQRFYYYDADAIKEPTSPSTHARYANGRSDHHKYADGGPGDQTLARTFEHVRKGPVKKPTGWDTSKGDGAHGSRHKTGRGSPGVTPKTAGADEKFVKANQRFHFAIKDVVPFRNKRSVWHISTQPYKGAHFATFPAKLVEPCILAGCPADGVVLDPFCGTATVGEVCVQYGRRFIGIDLNIELARKRIRKARHDYGTPLFDEKKG